MSREAELIRRIKAKCLECSGTRRQAKDCACRSCPLWAVTDLQQPREPRTVKRAEGVQLTIKIKVHG